MDSSTGLPFPHDILHKLFPRLPATPSLPPQVFFKVISSLPSSFWALKWAAAEQPGCLEKRNKFKQLPGCSCTLLGPSRRGHLCFLFLLQGLRENVLWGLGENDIKWIHSAVRDHDETGEEVQNQFILITVFRLPSSRLFRRGADGSNWSLEYLRSFFGLLILAYQFQ